MKFVIEHLEPRVWKWCIFEYTNISKIVGKENLIFTNIKRKNKNLEKLGFVYKKKFLDYANENSLDWNKICVLDPEAKKLLEPKDSKQFNYFIFGGILGDNPPRKRTGPELTQFLSKAQTRHIGEKQMSTDNAVLTTKLIADGKRFDEINFVDEPEIQMNKVLSLNLPYRYVNVGTKENQKPQMSENLLKFLKRKKGF